jgi:D-alanyl-D-alanine dipeptidase
VAGIVDIADPRVLAVSIEESGEPLVDLRDEPSIRVDEAKSERSERWCEARAGVAERLRWAQEACPPSVRLLVVEAFRPLWLQRRFFERDLERVAARYRHWDEPAIHEFTARYVAPPDIVPPHSTGGALDVTLVRDGAPLDLGTPVNADPEVGDGACHTNASGLDPGAQANRKLLVDVMAGAGFANYPAEWWHWSYGDRYWAHTTGAACAIYGTAR